MKFDDKELPFNQFEALGMDKKAVLSLPHMDLIALLSGRRTSLFRFNNINLGDQTIVPALDVKMSLVRNQDDSVSLKFHPIYKEAPNIFKLAPEELKDLKEGNKVIIEKRLSKTNGQKDDFLIQYDPETKEFVGKPISDMVLPREIDGIKLTEVQREDWRHGRDVEVNGKKVRIDLINTAGFAGSASSFVLDGGIIYSAPSIEKKESAGKAQDQGQGQAMDHTQHNRGMKR